MIGQSAGKDFAYILGVFLGDGCVTKERGRYLRFRLNTIDQDFALATKAAIEAVSEYAVNVHQHAVAKSSKPNWSLGCYDPILCDTLVRDTKAKRVIPEYVHDWTRENRVAFIAGLMDSEGFVAQKSVPNVTNRSFYMGFKSCDEWVPDFIRVLQNVGVRIGKIGVEKPRHAGYKTPVRFSIKMQSWIDAGCYFNIGRKQDRVNRWKACEPYTERSLYPRRSASETTRQTAPVGC